MVWTLHHPVYHYDRSLGKYVKSRLDEAMPITLPLIRALDPNPPDPEIIIHL